MCLLISWFLLKGEKESYWLILVMGSLLIISLGFTFV